MFWFQPRHWFDCSCYEGKALQMRVLCRHYDYEGHILTTVWCNNLTLEYRNLTHHRESRKRSEKPTDLRFPLSMGAARKLLQMLFLGARHSYRILLNVYGGKNKRKIKVRKIGNVCVCDGTISKFQHFSNYSWNLHNQNDSASTSYF